MSNIYKEVFLAALNGGLSRNHSVDEAIISAAKAASNVVSNDYIMRKIKESEGDSLRFTRSELERIVDYYTCTRLADRSPFDVKLIGKITTYLDEVKR